MLHIYPFVALFGLAEESVLCRQGQPELFQALQHIGNQPRSGIVAGPIQDDEALLLFALARVMGVKRVLELGGLSGHSALNFLRAMRCVQDRSMYSVDVRPVKSQGPRHFTITRSHPARCA